MKNLRCIFLLLMSCTSIAYALTPQQCNANLTNGSTNFQGCDFRLNGMSHKVSSYMSTINSISFPPPVINLSNTQLSNADSRGVSYFRANLSGAVLQNASLQGANFSCANLAYSYLQGAQLQGANLSNFGSCNGVNLTYAALSNANLSGANLKGANLNHANLFGTILTDANLESSNLTGAMLFSTILTGANLSGAIWINGQRCKQGSIGRCNQ